MHNIHWITVKPLPTACTMVLIVITITLQYTTGYPIAWCIADQENTTVVQLFFTSIKERSPNTDVHVLMSDDGK